MKDTLSRNGIFNPPPTIAKPLVDLSRYFRKIPDYETITELPQEHIDYLNSVRGTSMVNMFGEWDFEAEKNIICGITSLDANSWDVSCCVSMSSMFWQDRNIKSFYANSWKTYSLENTVNMFRDCSNLSEVDISNWNTSKVTDMHEMFNGCGSLTNLDLSNWDTSACTNMGGMFYGCNSLTSLDISNWNTSKVTSINSMFCYCNELTTIIGSIDMSSCETCDMTFYDCPNLRNVHLKNVPRSLNFSHSYGTEGVTYIIDNYID